MGLIREIINMFTAAVIILSSAGFLSSLGLTTFYSSVFSLGGLLYMTAIAWCWMNFARSQ